MPIAQDYYYKIRTCLARMWAETYIDSASNLQDSKIFDENTIRDLLNLTYDWNLINGNPATFNNAGFDLIDCSKKIIVQVSSTITTEKVSNSITKSDINDYKGYRLICFGISLEPKYPTPQKGNEYPKPQFISFNEDDRWTLKILSKLYQGMSNDLDRLINISNYLESQYGQVKKWTPQKKPKKPNNARRLYKWIADIHPEYEWEEYQVLADSSLLFEKLSSFQEKLRRLFYDFVSNSEYKDFNSFVTITIPEPNVTSLLQDKYGFDNCYNVMKSFCDKNLTSDPQESYEEGEFKICPGDGCYFFYILHEFVLKNSLPFDSLIVDLDFSLLDELETE